MAEKLSINTLFACARDVATNGGTSEDWCDIMHSKYPTFSEDAIERSPDKSRNDAIVGYWKGQFSRLRSTLQKRLDDAKERKNTPIIEGLKLGLATIKFERKESTRSSSTAREVDGLVGMLTKQASDNAKQAQAERERLAKERSELEAERREKEGNELAELLLAETDIPASAGQVANGKAE